MSELKVLIKPVLDKTSTRRIQSDISSVSKASEVKGLRKPSAPVVDKGIFAPKIDAEPITQEVKKITSVFSRKEKEAPFEEKEKRKGIFAETPLKGKVKEKEIITTTEKRDEGERGRLNKIFGSKGFGGLLKASVATVLFGVVIKGIGKITNRLGEASPMLAGILQVMKNAVNMFLLPIGNMVASWLMPLAQSMTKMSIEFNTLFAKNGFWKSLATIVTKYITVPAINWIKDLFTDAISSLKRGINEITAIPSKITGAITSGISSASDSIKGGIASAGDSINSFLAGIKTSITSLPSKITESVNNATATINSALTSAIETIRAIPSRISESITSGVSTLSNQVKGVIDSILSLPSRIIEGIKGLMPKGVSDAVETVKGTATGAISKVTGAATGAFNTVTSALSGVTSKVTSLIPLANGGIATAPTPAIVGERGPEAIIPLDLAPNLGVTIVFNGDVYGMNDFEAKINQSVNKLISKRRYLA